MLAYARACDMTKVYSEGEVSTHNVLQDAWVIVDGRVCDITGFLRSHPGGLGVFNGHLGNDVSELLRSPAYHQHTLAAYEILDQCCIGVVKGAQHIVQAVQWSSNYKEWKEKELIDWSKPILPQVAQLGEDYNVWVHSPVNRNIRLFHSDFLEFFSMCRWWLVPLCWIPLSLYMMWLATTNAPCTIPWISEPHPLSWVGVTALLPVGVLWWTLIEYILHRFLFHMEPRYSSGLALQFHFLIHGQHHKAPSDDTRLVFPILPAAVIMMAIYMTFVQFLPLAETRALFAGGLLGYVTYELMHYYLHHGSPEPNTYLAHLKSYHVAHHYINHNRGYGVSSKMWDIPFGTEMNVASRLSK